MTDGAKSQSLTKAASSASKASISSVFGPNDQVLMCKVGDPPDRSYEPCDIASLKLDLAKGAGNKASVTLKGRRRMEPIAPSVASDYQGALKTHDLVLEALADVQAVTHAPSARPTTTEGRKPLSVTLTATNGPSHTHRQPKHPRTRISGSGVYTGTDGGAPAKAEIFSAAPDYVGASIFGPIWPFGASRTRTYELDAGSCGVTAGGKSTTSLAMLLAVMPDEEWTVSMGIPSPVSGSRSKDANRLGGAKGPDGKKAVPIVTTAVSTRGGLETTQTLSRYGASDFSTSYGLRQVKARGLIATETKLTETDATFGVPSFAAEEDREVRSFKIERKSGGQTTSFDASGIINKLRKVERFADLFKKIFSTTKLGWSVSASYAFFGGQLDFAWGRRWPKSYVEENRVYYVERYVSLGGRCDLFDITVEGSCGLELKGLAFEATALVYLSVNAKLTLSPHGQVSYTNRLPASADGGLRIDCSGEISPECGVKGGGRAFGYSLNLRAALVTKLELEATAAVTVRTPPELKASCKSEKIRLVGEVVVQGRTASTYQLDPMVLVDEKTLFENEKIW
ncbi:hypothetical protein CFHF_03965 [Caulobacter flavus]|uniref:Uncharacterized protein n=1 Tax=Caulobacter flavus TaxID=1679497 RepID=A0A2N5CZD4_9CAUL|nr:hypothetical protein [Caulobacter flavus]AYV45147.1 hypothetical protein C1707_02205 [Caulobacter flavus]PLR19173.1 hypothetical protein CFHF_03965 [Caulobacter flavus]